ncbi:hypothetical protein GCM10020295_16300 [Streptomyces cinereospinus]
MPEHTATRIPGDIDERFRATGVNLSELFAAPHLSSSLGVRIEAAAPDRVVATMVLDASWADGLSRRGACSVLAETVGSIGAILLAGPERLAVGVDLNLTHHHDLPPGPPRRSRCPRRPGPT